MNKKIISTVVFAGVFCLAGFVLAALTDPLGGATFTSLLERIVSGVATLITTLGVIMIIVAGILYLTSAGSPEKVGTAKKALVYAIAGIAVGLAATAIVEIIKDVVGVRGS